MIQKVLKAQGILLLTLIALNSMVIISVKNEKNKSTEVTQVSEPDGMKYMEYCEGGISKTLVNKSDTGCIAEYPGDFAIFVIGLYSMILFIIFPALYIFIVKMYSWMKPKKRVHLFYE